MTIYEKLSNIQNELSVPKEQHNSFGNYNYRSCEDILAKVTPICKKNGTVLLLTDELNNIGDRFYVKARAELIDLESGGSIATYAYAREELEKKGMDGSQITGASSSYARKYALNGLFCIDDVEDSDFTNTGEKQKVPESTTTTYAEVEKTKTIGNYRCVECGKPVTDKIHDYSMKKYGNSYCMDCQKKYAR